MNPKYFLESMQLTIVRKGRIADTRTADCLEAIAHCIRTIASTDPEIGALILTGIKLCRGESSLRIARIIETFARDIRLEASRNGQKNQSFGSINAQKSISRGMHS
jgi:hypothetical protein